MSLQIAVRTLGHGTAHREKMLGQKQVCWRIAVWRLQAKDRALYMKCSWRWAITAHCRICNIIVC